MIKEIENPGNYSEMEIVDDTIITLSKGKSRSQISMIKKGIDVNLVSSFEMSPN